MLNRMPFLETLLTAYMFTETQAYLDKALYLLEHWIDNCPVPDYDFLIKHSNVVTGWRTLEVGIRMFSSWPFFLRTLLMGNKLTPSLFEKIMVSIYEHGDVLATVPKVYWPKADHNHYLMENLGLLTIALYFPELKKADEWRAFSLRELERCTKAQLMEEGGQIEGCPGYHHGCVYWFYLAAARAKSFGFGFSEGYMGRLKNAVGYSMYCHRPTGDDVLWGDSFKSRSGIFAALLGYLLFNDPQNINILSNYAGKDIVTKTAVTMAWEIDSEKDVLTLTEGSYLNQDSQKPPLYNYQPGLDQYIARTSWDKDAFSLFFACRLPVNNAHAHIDPMSFDFTAFGQNLIADPSAFCYREDAQRKKYKSAEWHSTLLINDKPPFEYISSWAFGPQKDGHIIRTGQKNGIFYAEALQNSYLPAVHKRFIAIVNEDALVVFDKVTNLQDSDSIRLYFHLNTTELASISSNVFFSKHGNIVMTSIFSDNLCGEILDGTIASELDLEQPSKRIGLINCGKENARVFVSVFMPSKKSSIVQADIKNYSYDDKKLSVSLLIDGALVKYDFEP